MGLRGYGSEIALGLSCLAFAAGVTADAAAEHVGINDAAVHQLSTQQDGIQQQLIGSYPVLESLSAEGHITVTDASKLGASEEWFRLHRVLDHVDEELDEATAGNGVLNLAGKLGWVLGGVATAASLITLNETSSIRAHRLSRDTRLLRDSLQNDYDLEGKLVGLDRPSEIPQIDIDSANLAAFSVPNPKKGLSLLAKRAESNEVASEALKIIQGLEANNKHYAELVEFISPLFGAQIEQVAGGYNAQDFGDRIATFVDHCTRLVTVQMRGGAYKEYEVDDPNEDRHLVQPALRLLDKILPLDQQSEHNPACDTDYEDYGRHWIDYVQAKANKLTYENDLLEV